jgi:hypothetical protein
MWPIVPYGVFRDGRHAPTGFVVHGTGIACRACFDRGSGEYLVPLPGRPGDESPVSGAVGEIWKPPRAMSAIETRRRRPRGAGRRGGRRRF